MSRRKEEETPPPHTSPLQHFFEPEKFQETTDKWGKPCTVIGYSAGYELLNGRIPETALVRYPDGSVMGVNYQSLNL